MPVVSPCVYNNVSHFVIVFFVELFVYTADIIRSVALTESVTFLAVLVSINKLDHSPLKGSVFYMIVLL